MGEIFEQEIQCIYHNSFLASSEYWQIWNPYPTQKSTTIIVFPKKRPPKSSYCIVKVGTREKQLPESIKEGVADSKPSLTVEIDNPDVNTFYKVGWEW